jgi:hypothetical protein
MAMTEQAQPAPSAGRKWNWTKASKAAKHPLFLFFVTSLFTSFLIPMIQGFLQENQRYDEVYSELISSSMEYVSKTGNVIDIYERQMSDTVQISQIIAEYNQASTGFNKNLLLLRIGNEAFYKRRFKAEVIDDLLSDRKKIDQRLSKANQLLSISNSFANRDVLIQIKEAKALVSTELTEALLKVRR